MGSANFINTRLNQVQYLKSTLINEKEVCKFSKLNVNKTLDNYCRNNDNIKNNYIVKSIHRNSINSRNNIIIYDWDDTLMCTSYLTDNDVFKENFKVPYNDIEKLYNLEKKVFELLKISIENGHTYIVTNATKGWIEYSINNFFPSIIPLLNKIRVISARDSYANIFPNDCKKWKVLTFLDIEKEYDNILKTNIICVGDSIIEMEAGLILSSRFPKCYFKTVKFREYPKIDELCKQIHLTIEQFSYIYKAVKNLSIHIKP